MNINLLAPIGKVKGDRKQLGISLAKVWIPYATTKTLEGELTLTPEQLGAPVKLVRNEAGEVQYTTDGRPKTRIDKGIKTVVRTVQANLEAALILEAHTFIQGHAEEFATFSQECRIAGQADSVALDSEMSVYHATAKAAKEQAKLQSEVQETPATA
jgi:hypothetical protein